MAGSYRHCLKRDGTFCFNLIENMGDAHEACEDMFFMINFLAGGNPDRIREAENACYAAARGETDGSLGVAPEGLSDDQ